MNNVQRNGKGSNTVCSRSIQAEIPHDLSDAQSTERRLHTTAHLKADFALKNETRNSVNRAELRILSMLSSNGF